MYSSFISLVVVLDETDDRAQVAAFVSAVGAHLAQRFADYEIVFVDNGARRDLDGLEAPEAIRANCYLVALSNRVGLDIAILAGFERANGDYAVVFDTQLAEHPEFIDRLYERAQDGADIVLLRDRRPARRFSPASLLFFALVRGGLDPRDRKEVLVSRRALNWILRYRHRTAYLSEIYSSSGYRTEAVEVEAGRRSRSRTRADRQKLAWAALTRMSSLPLQIASGSILALAAGVLLLSANALTVKLFQVDLLGEPAFAVPGWTYLVLLMSLGFLLTNVTLYAILRVLLVISEDVRDEPSHVVEFSRRL